MRRGEDLADCLRAELAALEAEEAEAQAELDNDDCYVSQGVARYAPSTGTRTEISDPTAVVVRRHQQDTAKLRGRIRALRGECAGLRRRIATVEAAIRPTKVVVAALPPDDRALLLSRYGSGSPLPWSRVAERAEIDERTAQRRIARLAAIVPAMVAALVAMVKEGKG
jgi:hypothetical protein